MKLHMLGSDQIPGVGQARECRIEFQAQFRRFVRRRATGPACACVANHLWRGIELIWNYVCVDTACQYCCNTIAHWTCRHYLSAWTFENCNCSCSCHRAEAECMQFCSAKVLWLEIATDKTNIVASAAPSATCLKTLKRSLERLGELLAVISRRVCPRR